jgi:phosphate-selective porin OprO/OprP
VLLVCLGPAALEAQQTSTLDETIEAGEAEAEEPARRLLSWNEFDGKFFSIRMGGGLLVDYGAYSQDETSKAQIELGPDLKVRDARFSLKGRLKFKRSVTWTCGLMYYGPTDEFLFRETGIMIEVPEISGHIFVGRTKEGFSLNKVMVGYSGWTMERATISDATIPILADGVKWLGYAPKLNLLWNLGFYGDWLSEGQSFSTYDRQVSGRLAWLPVKSQTTGLHLGTSFRHGKTNEEELQLRSRPESTTAPYFVDTGTFPAETATTIGLEAYYRPGSLLLGGEYIFHDVNAPEKGDPFVHGGDVVATWLVTGETRAYNTRGGFFNSVSPRRPVFQGGPGAWELVARFSYIDLDSGDVQGGKFWRLTPMVNWHLSDNLRLELVYGYGSLDRFELTGGRTHFFQTRLQMLL